MDEVRLLTYNEWQIKIGYMPKGVYIHQKLSERTKRSISRSLMGRRVSKITRDKLSKYKGKLSSQWKEKPTYGIVHYWLRTNFGNPKSCEICKTTNENKKYDWALLKGKKYERVESNFIRLCRKCHVRYDFKGKLRVRPNCLDCGLELKDWNAKRCYSHAQKYRFLKYV